VKLLAASVSAALRVYNYDADKRTSGSSSGATSAAASVAQVTQDDPSLSPMSPEEFSNILKEVGLAEDQLPNWLRSFYALPENVRKMTGVDPLELSAETLVSILLFEVCEDTRMMDSNCVIYFLPSSNLICLFFDWFLRIG
jgi:hypothetical protein